MDERYNPTRYVINKYIGNYEDMFLFPVSTTYWGSVPYGYTVCLEPDCTVHLINVISFFIEPEIQTIPAKEIQSMKIYVNYFMLTVFSTPIGAITVGLFCFRYKIWPYSWFSCFAILFLVVFLLQYFTVPFQYIKIKTYHGKKYTLHFLARRKSKTIVIIKSRIAQLHQSRKKKN